MPLPEQLLLSDLLRRHVRDAQGLDHGAGVIAWMHPPVHRLLGWISKPSAFGDRRLAWRLNQLRGLAELELFVEGEPAITDLMTVERLPTLIEAALVGRGGAVLGSVADAAVELRSGRIRHYLVSRSDPRLPGSSRWRLAPDRIVDQQPGQVITALQGLDDLPLARASVRQQFLRRSRRWRDQVQEETGKLREQFQQAGDRFEERLEGWLEQPPWDEGVQGPGWEEREPEREFDPEPEPRRRSVSVGDAQGNWPAPEREPEWRREGPPAEAWDGDDWGQEEPEPEVEAWDRSSDPPDGTEPRRSRYGGAFRDGPPPATPDDDPWV